ncbi:MAG: response regulator transcription factor [Saprospiraceae bacterium]|nr:response regulator transcription factor [Saprospiraceae bacterium]
MIKAIIIEDESLIARQLHSKITAVADDVQVIEILPSLKTAKRWLLNNAEPDLMFMDIQLSDGISFELFEHFQLKCPIIFTTAYDEYAVRAFKVNGIDYLLKPVDAEDLKKAIQKARLIIGSMDSAPNTLPDLMQTIQSNDKKIPIYKEKFVVSVKRNWVPIMTKDIALFLRDSLIYIYTFSGERFITDYTTLDEIEELLNPKFYYRANRQSIIHIDAIQSIKPLENQKLVLHLKAPLSMSQDISREKAPAFKRWWER